MKEYMYSLVASVAIPCFVLAKLLLVMAGNQNSGTDCINDVSPSIVVQSFWKAKKLHTRVTLRTLR